MGTLPEDVLAALSQNTVILKSQNDSSELTVTLVTKSNVREATYEMWIRRTLGVGASESGSLPVEIRVLTGRQTTTTTITTTISTTTTRLCDQATDPSTYVLVMSATVAAVVLVAVLVLSLRRT